MYALSSRAFKSFRAYMLCAFSLSVSMLLLAACGAAGPPAALRDSGDPAYEALTVQIEGLRELGGGIAEISIAEMRSLPQHDLEASYKRTTGLNEEYAMSGPLLKDVIALAGGNLDDYAGFGLIGRDNYYCLFPREVIDGTPDLMLALTVDGSAKLDDDKYPAWAAVQGQFGPYWVKQVEKIIMYAEVPQKNITNVWVFSRLTEGLPVIEYEYYGSQDNAIDLEQVFSRLDYVDSKAFFSMKSADGFMKNEAMNMVKSRYYIKIDGEDAPTNVAPYIKLGMNVQKISWFSTSADAVFFPEMLMMYMDTRQVNGETGIPLDELLYEVGLGTVKAAVFDILGTAGQRYSVPGSELSGAIMVPLANGGAKVLWQDGLKYESVELQRIRVSG